MQIVCQKYKFTPLQRLCNAQKKAKYLSLRTGKAGQEEEEEEEEEREEREERNKRNDERGGAYAGSRAKKGQKQMGYGVWGMKCKCECRWAGADWMSKLSKSAKPQYFIQG